MSPILAVFLPAAPSSPLILGLYWGRLGGRGYSFVAFVAWVDTFFRAKTTKIYAIQHQVGRLVDSIARFLFSVKQLPI